MWKVESYAPRCLQLSQGDPAGLHVLSLSVDVSTIPIDIAITAVIEDSGVIMGVRHCKYTLEGMQHYPERILSEAGDTLFCNIPALMWEKSPSVVSLMKGLHPFLLQLV